MTKIDDIYYGSFYNYEYERDENIGIQDFYPSNITIEHSQKYSDIDIFFNKDIKTYLRGLHRIYELTSQVIGLQSTDGPVAMRGKKKPILSFSKEGLKKIHFFTDKLLFPIAVAAYTDREQQQISYMCSNYKFLEITSEDLFRATPIGKVAMRSLQRYDKGQMDGRRYKTVKNISHN